MGDEQQEQTGAGDRWGDPISDERKEELRTLFEQQQTWSATPEAERRWQASHFQGVRLTGAEVAAIDPEGWVYPCVFARCTPAAQLRLNSNHERCAHLQA
jgi:MoaA/NifB/PqqE/SkfB family radical SAM enzyme